MSDKEREQIVSSLELYRKMRDDYGETLKMLEAKIPDYRYGDQGMYRTLQSEYNDVAFALHKICGYIEAYEEQLASIAQ